MEDQSNEEGGGLDSELESFRQQWLSDLRRGRGAGEPSRQPAHGEPLSGDGAPSARRPSVASRNQFPHRSAALHEEEEDGFLQARSFDEPIAVKALSGQESEDLATKDARTEPVSALDYYEAAVEKENLGSLGDSLKLYRKAFRMDGNVDQLYRKKHFAAKATQAATTATASSSTAAHGKQPLTKDDMKPQTIEQLIASFSDLVIQPAPPLIEGTPPPPSPIVGVPDEVLLLVLRAVADENVADFARLSQVCKKFAYLVATEERIWRHVALGRKVGFLGMHYDWQCDTVWEPLDKVEANEEGRLLSPDEIARRRDAEKLVTAQALLPVAHGGSWKHMFRHRPRIRFNGCYISTVNYVRAGQASGYQITWNSPVHIVTYYRYLRFFRDGSVISLLTTNEPTEVVHHLTREALWLHQGGAQPHLASAMMALALTGRWRLSSGFVEEEAAATTSLPASTGASASASVGTSGAGTAAGASSMTGGGGARAAGSSSTTNVSTGKLRGSAVGVDLRAGVEGGASPGEAEGDLIVETEGVRGSSTTSGWVDSTRSRHMYRLEFSLRSAGKGARNNKLIWRSFSSYNRLTDDWGEFSLKHDKPFFFSRVKSYGDGE